MVNQAGGEAVVGTEEEGLNAATEPDPLGVDLAAAAEMLEAETGDQAGLAPESARPTDAEAGPDLAVVAQEEVFAESPYLLFGERIIVREIDGTTFVTKPYTLPIGRPKKIIELIAALEPFPSRNRALLPDTEGLVPALDPALVEYQVLDSFDDEWYTQFDKFDVEGAVSKAVPLSDLMVVTAVPSLLEQFEEFLDLFAGGGVPQIELEAKIIEIRETDSFDYGGGATFMFGSNNFVRELDIRLPNFAESTEALLTLGAVQDGMAFDAILEAIKGWQNVTIETRPKTVVRAGGVAYIDASTDLPFLTFKTLNSNGSFTTATEYKKTGTQLWISPRRVGSNTLALDVKLQGSQQVGSQSIVQVAGEEGDAGQQVEVPVIAYRTAKTVVHLQPGQTLVIGGLTQEREQDITSKVPLLGDIPVLGWLFRSTFKATERQHVIFAISPRIIQRSDFETDI